MNSRIAITSLLAVVTLLSTGCPQECQDFNDCTDDEYCTSNFVCAPLRIRGDPTCSSCVDAGYDYDAGLNDEDAGLPTCPDNECCDLDGDTFFHCEGPNPPTNPTADDCDDLRWAVRPGGYEFPTNGIDDNCNGLTDAQETPPCTCDAASGNATSALGSMDLCDATLLSSSMSDGDAAQYLVSPSFYGMPSLRGGCMLSMSSGNANGDQATGQSFGQTFPDPDPEGAGSASVNDLATLKMDLQVPENVLGLEFNFFFMSTEWPEFLCLNYNDTFYTIVESAAVNSGAKTNISFDPNGRPITVNVGFFELPTQWTISALGGTPYGETLASGDDSCPGDNGECMVPEYCADHPVGALAHQGSGSGWLTTRTPVNPGETMHLTLTIHDEGDGIYDSLVLIDNFRWLSYRPAIGTVKVPPTITGPTE